MDSLPSNLFYKQMVDILKAYSGQGQEDSPHCGNCDERKSLEFYCSDCNFFLCKLPLTALEVIKSGKFLEAITSKK